MTKKAGKTYQAQILDMMRTGKIPHRPGTVGHIHVYHDDWCAALRGEGYCDCNPDVSMKGPRELMGDTG